MKSGLLNVGGLTNTQKKPMARKPDPLYWQKLRQKSVKKWKENYQPKPINKRSKKRAKEEGRYSRRVKVWKIENPDCKARLTGCMGNTWDCHHRAGKENEMLLIEKYWLPVCRNCHDIIGEMPIEQAIELGLSERRNVNIEQRKSRLNNEG